MSKSNVNSMKVPLTAAAANPPYATPSAVEFTLADSAVRVIVEDIDNDNDIDSNPYSEADGSRQEPPAMLLNGSRKPINLAACPECAQKHVRTRTRTYPDFVTWSCVAVSAMVCFPLFWVPLVADPMKKTDHFCQSCGAKIGTVKSLQGCCVTERA